VINCDACLRTARRSSAPIFNHGATFVVIVPELCSGCDKCLPCVPRSTASTPPEWIRPPDAWWELPLSRLDPYSSLSPMAERIAPKLAE